MSWGIPPLSSGCTLRARRAPPWGALQWNLSAACRACLVEWEAIYCGRPLGQLRREYAREGLPWPRSIEGICGNYVRNPTLAELAPVYAYLRTELTVVLERFARALVRLSTIGKLGALAQQSMVYITPFLMLRDEQLGLTAY